MALSDNLVAYWALEEASGTRNDSAGVNHLTDNNTVLSATGKIGTAADFERTNSEFLSVADNAAVSTGDIDFSLHAWFKLESIGDYGFIAAKEIDTPASSRDYGLFVSLDNQLTFEINGGGVQVVETTTLLADVWHYVAAGHSASGNVLWISLDGGTPVTAGTGGTAPDDSSAPFTIGAMSYSGFERYFDGLIDEVGLWKRDIRSDIAALYNSGAGLSYAEVLNGGPIVTGNDAKIIFRKA